MTLAILTLTTEQKIIVIEGADRLAPLVSQAQAAATAADAARDEIVAALAALAPVGLLTEHDMSTGTLPDWAVVSRAQGSTDGFYDDEPGRAYNTVLANEPVFWHGGMWRGGSSKNWLPNSTVPITRTVALAIGSYAVKYNGPGTLTTSLPASGPAVGSGFGLVPAGLYQIITITTAGNVTFTITGTVYWYACDNDVGTPTAPSLGPLIVTGASAATRNADVLLAAGDLDTAMKSGAATLMVGTSRVGGGASGSSLIIAQNNNAQIKYTVGGVEIWNGGAYLVDRSIGESLPASSEETRWAVAFDGTGISFGGGTKVPLSTGSATWPAGTTISIGGGNSTTDADALNGIITRIGFTDSRLADADLYDAYNTYELDDSAIKLPNWRAALRARRAGTADAIVLCDGTSHFAGTNPSTNFKATSWPSLLAAELTARGIPAVSDGNLGNGSQPPSAGVSTYDSTVTFGGSVTLYGPNLGGNGLRLQASGDRIDKTVARATDTFTVLAMRGSVGTNKIVLSLTGGGSPTTFTLTANDSVQSFSITVPRLANNSFRIAWNSGDVIILARTPSDTQARVVQIVNAGYLSATAALLNDATLLAVQAALNAALTIYGATTNDWAGATTPSAFKVSTAANIAAGQATGDVLVLTDPPSATSVASYVSQAQYTDALIATANAAGAPVIDLFGAMQGGYPAWNGNGFYFDTIHLNPWGYQMVAELIAPVVA